MKILNIISDWITKGINFGRLDNGKIYESFGFHVDGKYIQIAIQWIEIEEYISRQKRLENFIEFLKSSSCKFTFAVVEKCDGSIVKEANNG